jgi:hypothetical protein
MDKGDPGGEDKRRNYRNARESASASLRGDRDITYTLAATTITTLGKGAMASISRTLER